MTDSRSARMREQDGQNEEERRRTDFKSVMATPAGRRVMAQQCADTLQPNPLLRDLFEACPDETRLMIELLIKEKLDG